MNNPETLRDGKRGPHSKVDGKVFPSLPTRYRNSQAGKHPSHLGGGQASGYLKSQGDKEQFLSGYWGKVFYMAVLVPVLLL